MTYHHSRKMSRFQRMVVIPEDEYKQIIRSMTPLQQQFIEAEKQHEKQSLIRDPYSRLVHQSTTLDTMKSLKDRIKGNISFSTPKNSRGRANQLYNAIEPHIHFNDRGEMIDDSNNSIKDSHIEDLIQYAVRENRRNLRPEGWHQFISRLREINVPKSSLNRETIKEINHESIVNDDKKPFKQPKGRKENVPFKEELADEEKKSISTRLRKSKARNLNSSFYNY